MKLNLHFLKRKLLKYFLVCSVCFFLLFTNTASAKESKKLDIHDAKLQEVILDIHDDIESEIKSTSQPAVLKNTPYDDTQDYILNEAVMISDPDIIKNKDKEGFFSIFNLKGGIEKITPRPEMTKEIFDDWYHGDFATGRWFGARPLFEQNGLKVNSSLIYSPFMNTVGGMNNDANGRGYTMYSLGVSLDTEKAHMWKGGTFFMLYQKKKGCGINSAMGYPLDGWDYPDEVNQIQEFWYQQKLFNNKLRFKFGKQDPNVEFGMTYAGSTFMNLAFTVNPAVPKPGFPYPQLGLITEYKPKPWLSLKDGIFTKNGDPFNLMGIEIKPNTKLPGRYMLGSWQTSSNTGFRIIEDVNASGKQYYDYNRNYGIYASFEQMVYKEKKDNSKDLQGLTIFGQLGLSPEDKNDIGKYGSLGLHYRGPIPNRDNDITGLAVNYTNFASRIKSIPMANGGRFADGTNIEFFYRIYVNKWFYLQPDIQYLINPNGTYNSSIAIGLRSVITF